MNTLPILDRNDEEDAILFKLDNGIIETAVLVYHADEDNEEVYVLRDMQGQYPKTFEEVPEYDWYRAEDVDW